MHDHIFLQDPSTRRDVERRRIDRGAPPRRGCAAEDRRRIRHDAHVAAVTRDSGQAVRTRDVRVAAAVERKIVRLGGQVGDDLVRTSRPAAGAVDRDPVERLARRVVEVEISPERVEPVDAQAAAVGRRRHARVCQQFCGLAALGINGPDGGEDRVRDEEERSALLLLPVVVIIVQLEGRHAVGCVCLWDLRDELDEQLVEPLAGRPATPRRIRA